MRVPQRFANDLPGGEDLLDVSSEIQALTDILLLKSLQPREQQLFSFRH